MVGADMARDIPCLLAGGTLDGDDDCVISMVDEDSVCFPPRMASKQEQEQQPPIVSFLLI